MGMKGINRVKKSALQKSTLWLALGMALSMPLAMPAFAANTDGSLVGHVPAGATVTVRNPETGFERTVTADSDGSYRFPLLPVGRYTVEVNAGGSAVGGVQTVVISLGNATTHDVGTGTAELEAVTVQGSSISPIDVSSTETATNLTIEQIDRLPVARDALSVALLAPGVVRGEFGGVSFGGSSVAENAVYVNGLNITDFYNRVGFSTVPFNFFQEFQVKTGGYSVEFGRTTGGVLNTVTKSGTNEFKAGAQLVYEPDWLQSEQQDNPGRISRFDEFDRAALNLWASGAIIKDKLFFFGMYEARKYDPRNSDDGYENFFDGRSNPGFWGAKVDWQITSDHVISAMGFSDKAKLTTDEYGIEPGGDLNGARLYQNTTFNESGGDNWNLTYTGYLTDSFTMKAMYGENNRSSDIHSLTDDTCSLVQDRREGSSFLGCTSNTAVIAREDDRQQYRLDFDWQLGDHLLRFGYDHENNQSFYNQRYPGDGRRFEVFNAGSEVNGVPTPPGVDAYVRTREVRNEGTFETVNSAYYLEDNWNITQNFLLNIGIRNESFDNKNGQGASYIKMDDMWAPRLGFSWDILGDSSLKIFGNIGRYFLPVANVINIKQAGPFLDRRTFYAFGGFDENNIPILGEQLGDVDTSQGDGTVPDVRGEVDADMDPVYQDELILGFQKQIDANWSMGMRGIFRKLSNAIDDMEITYNGFCEMDSFIMGNPGEVATIYSDTDCDGESDAYVNIDTAHTGWAIYDVDGNFVGTTGWMKPKRDYQGLEIVVDRAWDNKWAFNASYTLSFSEGNAEGPVNSDTDFSDSGRTEAFDNPWVNFNGYGYLPNDRRHQIKLNGSYALNDAWEFGATLDGRSGRPVSVFGVGNPFDETEFHSFYVCTANCDAPHPDRTYTLFPRGSDDRLPWEWDVGASVTYKHSFGASDLSVKFAVFNLFDRQVVNEVNENRELESAIGLTNPLWGQGTGYQSARYGQITVSLDF
jgi:hypothetical protein